MLLTRPFLLLTAILLVPTAAAVPSAEAPGLGGQPPSRAAQVPGSPAPASAMVAQSEEVPATVPTPEEQHLTERLEKLESLVEEQTRLLNEARQEIDALHRLAEGLLQGCSNLDRAADTARQNGLEKGVTNPQARTDLLEGLKSFVRTIRASAPPPTPKATASSR